MKNEMKRILIIEDDIPMMESLNQYLSSEGFVTLIARNLAEATKQIDKLPDLILLDRNLHDGDGLSWMVRLRAQGNKLPAIVLTARSSQLDKITGLEFGATDYVTKPFDSRELLARIRTHLKINLSDYPDQHVLSIGPLELNLSLFVLRFEGKDVHLTPKELELLRFLMERPGRVFAREELHLILWGPETGEDSRAVDNVVLQLRKKTHLGVVETVRGLGYRLGRF